MFSAAKICLVINECQFNRKGMRGVDTACIRSFIIMQAVRLGEWYPDFDPEIRVKEKCFTPMELRLLLENAGFTINQLWGGPASNWNRQTLDRADGQVSSAVKNVREYRLRVCRYSPNLELREAES